MIDVICKAGEYARTWILVSFRSSYIRIAKKHIFQRQNWHHIAFCIHVTVYNANNPLLNALTTYSHKQCNNVFRLLQELRQCDCVTVKFIPRKIDAGISIRILRVQ